MDNETLATTSSPPGQPIPEGVLKELAGGEPPGHFVTLEIEGRRGEGIYLTKDFEPTTKDKAELLKVTFDDGGVSFFKAE